MTTQDDIETRLLKVCGEISAQTEIGKKFPSEMMSFSEQMDHIREYIRVGESGIAYECMVSLLESFDFHLTGSTAVTLLEVGLILGFKTSRPEDRRFDRNIKL